ncbi:hypothetical protein GCM10009601_61830 [Streptomyces thermospinosisporus]|uniref:Uncharacterized protein n=1 Tax=Streptomyces thermospinosisporus TaxID=161482 RepID=A0ABN1Z7E1_9ACTN
MRSRSAAGAVLGVLAATAALLDVFVGDTGVRLTSGESSGEQGIAVTMACPVSAVTLPFI